MTGPLCDSARLCVSTAIKDVVALTSYGRMDKTRFKPTPILRERRRSECARFALTDSRGEEIDVMVRDISKKGLSAAAAGEAPAVNQVVRAHLEDGRVLWGLVRWADGNLFGVEFDTRS